MNAALRRIYESVDPILDAPIRRNGSGQVKIERIFGFHQHHLSRLVCSRIARLNPRLISMGMTERF